MPVVDDPVGTRTLSGGIRRPDPRRIEPTVLSVSLMEIRSSDITPTVSFNIGVMPREKWGIRNPVRSMELCRSKPDRHVTPPVCSQP
jgi:hypothetical protein